MNVCLQMCLLSMYMYACVCVVCECLCLRVRALKIGNGGSEFKFYGSEKLATKRT